MAAQDHAYTVKLRNGDAPAEELTEAEFKNMEQVFGKRMKSYEVTKVGEKPAKPQRDDDRPARQSATTAAAGNQPSS